MPEVPFSNSRYTYIQGGQNGSFQAFDVHHILVRKSTARDFLLYFIILLLLANTCYLFLSKEKPDSSFLWSILLSVTFINYLNRKSIKKESVVVMPSFGVQLEIHYRSGRIIRRFVPIGKILKPVLTECVTPVTCYWSLALIVRGETELMLVFQELGPPVRMLVPVWKALCAATDIKENPDMVVEADQ